MRYIIKRFGNGGLHIVLRRTEGFKEGMWVDVKPVENIDIPNNISNRELINRYKELLYRLKELEKKLGGG